MISNVQIVAGGVVAGEDIPLSRFPADTQWLPVATPEEIAALVAAESERAERAEQYAAEITRALLHYRWQRDCRIVVDYMPPFPTPGTRHDPTLALATALAAPVTPLVGERRRCPDDDATWWEIESITDGVVTLRSSDVRRIEYDVSDVVTWPLVAALAAPPVTAGEGR